MYIVASKKPIDSAVSEMLMSISEQASDDKYTLEGENDDEKREEERQTQYCQGRTDQYRKE